jgi:uncharacterized membrane protein YgaE (UPF0421/DUF939 family)
MKEKKTEQNLSVKAMSVSLPDRIFNRMEVRIAVKAGVAASLSLYCGGSIAYYFDRPDYLLSGTWSVLSTFVVLQEHLGGTYRAAWVRFLGVLIGSLMGGLFTSLFGSNAISLGVSVVLTVLICSALKLKDSIRIACLSVSVVMILWGLHPSLSPWKFGMYRFFDSTVGILVAVFVSHTLWPSKATSHMRENIADTLEQINRLFQLELKIEPSEMTTQLEKDLMREIKKKVEETHQYLSDSELELLTKSKSLEIWESLIDHLNSIYKITRELRALQKWGINKIFDAELQNRLMETVESCSNMIMKLSAMLRNANAIEQKTGLSTAISQLNDDLNRFRKSRATRNFERQEVEQFFVFFYHLRLLVEELIKMKETIVTLNSESQQSA